MKISVVIPVYNSEKYLKRCLNSLKYQSNFKDLEIIIINDGSIDNSKKIILDFKNDSKNVIVKNVKHGGVSRARNIGINLATSKYITFLDADDYITNDYYKFMLKSVNDYNDSLIVSGFMVKYESSNTFIKRSFKNVKLLFGDEIINQFLSSNCIGPNVWNKLFITEIAKKIKFDEDISVAEDKWFVFQYLTRIDKCVILPSIQYVYSINDESIFRKPFNKNKLDSIIISNRIKKFIEGEYPIFIDKVYSYEIDVKSRVYCELVGSNVKNEFKNEYCQLRKDIKNYSVLKKIKNSNLKHTLAFILIKISPKLYLFVQKKLKFQYKI